MNQPQAESAFKTKLAHFLESRGHEAISTRGICLKKAAVLAGIGAQGKHTVVVSPRHGVSLRFAAVLTSAELEDDRMFGDDLCGDCTRCLDACPTGALKPYSIDIKRCMVYAAENPNSERSKSMSARLRNVSFGNPQDTAS